jgi:hypothetical protein
MTQEDNKLDLNQSINSQAIDYNNKLNSYDDWIDDKFKSINQGENPNSGQPDYNSLKNNPLLRNEFASKKTSYDNQLSAYNAFINRDLSFEEYDNIYNKNNDLSQRLLNYASYSSRNSIQLPNYYASMRSTQGYAESIAAMQPYYLDVHGNVVNEKPKSSSLYKISEYNGDWALREVPMTEDTDGQKVFSLYSIPSASSTYIGSAIRGTLNTWVANIPSSIGTLIRIGDDLIDYVAYGEDNNGNLETFANMLSNTSKMLTRQNKDEMEAFGGANGFIYGLSSGVGSVIQAMTGSNLGGSMGSVFGRMLGQNPVKTAMDMSRIGGLGLNSLAVASSFRELGKSRGIDDMTLSMLSLPMMAATIWSESKFGPNIFLDYYTNTSTRATLSGIFNNAFDQLSSLSKATGRNLGASEVKVASKTLIEQLTDFAKLKQGTALSSFAVGALEEGTEEVFEGLIQNSLQLSHDYLKEINSLLPSGSEATFGTKSIFEGIAENFVFGALAGGMVGGVLNTNNVRKSQLINAVINKQELELRDSLKNAYVSGMLGSTSKDINGNDITLDQNGVPTSISVADQLMNVFNSEIDSLVEIRDKYGLSNNKNINTELATEFLNNEISIDSLTKKQNRTDNENSALVNLQERNRKILSGVTNSQNKFNAQNNILFELNKGKYITGEQLSDEFKNDFKDWIKNIVEASSQEFDEKIASQKEIAGNYMQVLTDLLNFDFTSDKLRNVYDLFESLKDISNKYAQSISQIGSNPDVDSIINPATGSSKNNKIHELFTKLKKYVEQQDTITALQDNADIEMPLTDTDIYTALNPVFTGNTYSSIEQQKEAYLKDKAYGYTSSFPALSNYFMSVLTKDVKSITSGSGNIEQIISNLSQKTLDMVLQQLEEVVKNDQISMDDARQVHSGLMQLYAIVNQRKQFINSLALVSDESAAHDISLLFDMYQEIDNVNTSNELAKQKKLAGEEYFEDSNVITNESMIRGINKLAKPDINTRNKLEQMQDIINEDLELLLERLNKLNEDLRNKIENKSIIESQYSADNVAIEIHALKVLLSNNEYKKEINDNKLISEFEELYNELNTAYKNASNANKKIANELTEEQVKKFHLRFLDIQNRLSEAFGPASATPDQKNEIKNKALINVLKEIKYTESSNTNNHQNFANLYNDAQTSYEDFLTLLNSYNVSRGANARESKFYVRNIIGNIAISIWRGDTVKNHAAIVSDMINKLNNANNTSPILTNEQDAVLSHILSFLYQDKDLKLDNGYILGRQLYVTGAGGSGKTTIVKLVSQYIKNFKNNNPNAATIISVNPNNELINQNRATSDQQFTFDQFINAIGNGYSSQNDAFKNDNLIIFIDESHSITANELNLINSFINTNSTSRKIKVIYLGDPLRQSIEYAQLNESIHNEQTNQLKQIHRSGNSSVWQLGKQIIDSLKLVGESTYGKGLTYYKDNGNGVQSFNTKKELVDALINDSNGFIVVYNENNKKELLKEYPGIQPNKILLLSHPTENVKGLSRNRIYVLDKYLSDDQNNMFLQKTRLYVAVSRATDYVGVYLGDNKIINATIRTFQDDKQIIFSDASDLNKDQQYIAKKKQKYTELINLINKSRNVTDTTISTSLNKLKDEFLSIYKKIFGKTNNIRDIATLDRHSKIPSYYALNPTSQSYNTIIIAKNNSDNTYYLYDENDVLKKLSASEMNKYLNDNMVYYYTDISDLSYIEKLGTPVNNAMTGTLMYSNSDNTEYKVENVYSYNNKEYVIYKSTNNSASNLIGNYVMDIEDFKNTYSSKPIITNDFVEEDSEVVNILSSLVYSGKSDLNDQIPSGSIPVISTSLNHHNKYGNDNPEIRMRIELFNRVFRNLSNSSNIKFKYSLVFGKNASGDDFTGIGLFLDINESNKNDLIAILNGVDKQLLTDNGFTTLDDYVNDAVKNGVFVGYLPAPDVNEASDFFKSNASNWTHEKLKLLKDSFDNYNNEYIRKWNTSLKYSNDYQNYKLKYNKELFNIWYSFAKNYLDNGGDIGQSLYRTNENLYDYVSRLRSKPNTKSDTNKTLGEFKKDVNSKFGNSITIESSLNTSRVNKYTYIATQKEFVKESVFSIYVKWNWSFNSSGSGIIHLYMPEVDANLYNNDMYSNLTDSYNGFKSSTYTSNASGINKMHNDLRNNEFVNFLVSNNRAILNILETSDLTLHNIISNTFNKSIYNYVHGGKTQSDIKNNVAALYNLILRDKNVISSYINNKSNNIKIRHVVTNDPTNQFDTVSRYIQGFTLNDMIVQSDDINFPSSYTSIKDKPSYTTSASATQTPVVVLMNDEELINYMKANYGIDLGNDVNDYTEHYTNYIVGTLSQPNVIISSYLDTKSYTKILNDSEEYLYISEVEAKLELIRLLGVDIVDADVIFQENLSNHRGPLLGLVSDKKLYIRRKWNNGKSYASYEAVRHETIHYILNYILSKSERDALLSKAKSVIGSDATDLAAEEWIATKFEHFTKYTNSKNKKKGILNKFFNKMVKFFDNLFNSKSEIESFFERVDSGMYAKNLKLNTIYSSGSNTPPLMNNEDKTLIDPNVKKELKYRNETQMYKYFANNIEMLSFALDRISDRILLVAGYNKNLFNNRHIGKDFKSAIKLAKQEFSRNYSMKRDNFYNELMNDAFNNYFTNEEIDQVREINNLREYLIKNQSNRTSDEYIANQRKMKRLLALLSDMFNEYNRLDNEKRPTVILNQDGTYNQEFIDRIELGLGNSYMFDSFVERLYEIDVDSINDTLDTTVRNKSADNPVSESNESLDALNERGVTSIVNQLFRISGTYTIKRSTLSSIGTMASNYGVLDYFWRKEINTVANEENAKKALLMMAMEARTMSSTNSPFMLNLSNILKKYIKNLTSDINSFNIAGLSSAEADNYITSYLSNTSGVGLESLFSIYYNVLRSDAIDESVIDGFMLTSSQLDNLNPLVDKNSADYNIRKFNGFLSNMSYAQLANVNNLNVLIEYLKKVTTSNTAYAQYLAKLNDLHAKSRDLINSIESIYRSTVKTNYTKFNARFTDDGISYSTIVLQGSSLSETKDGLRNAINNSLYSGVGLVRSFNYDANTRFNEDVVVDKDANGYIIKLNKIHSVIRITDNGVFVLGLTDAEKSENLNKLSNKLGLNKILTQFSINIAVRNAKNSQVLKTILGADTKYANAESMLAFAMTKMLLLNKLAVINKESDKYKTEINYTNSINALLRIGIKTNQMESNAIVGAYDQSEEEDNKGGVVEFSEKDADIDIDFFDDVQSLIESKGITYDASSLWQDINDIANYVSYANAYIIRSSYYSVLGNKINTAILSSHYMDTFGSDHHNIGTNGIINAYIEDSGIDDVNNPFYTGRQIVNSSLEIIANKIFSNSQSGKIIISNASTYEGITYYNKGIRQDQASDEDYFKTIFTNFLDKLIKNQTLGKPQFSTAIIPIHQPSSRKYVQMVKIALDQSILEKSKRKDGSDIVSINRKYVAMHVLSMAMDYYNRYTNSFNNLFNDNSGFFQYLYAYRSDIISQISNSGIDVYIGPGNEIYNDPEAYRNFIKNAMVSADRGKLLNGPNAIMNIAMSNYIKSRVQELASIIPNNGFASSESYMHHLYLKAIEELNAVNTFDIKLNKNREYDYAFDVQLGNVFYDTSKTIDSLFDPYMLHNKWLPLYERLQNAEEEQVNDIVNSIFNEYTFNSSRGSLLNRTRSVTKIATDSGYQFPSNLKKLIADSTIFDSIEDSSEDSYIISNIAIANNLTLKYQDNISAARSYKAKDEKYLMPSLIEDDINKGQIKVLDFINLISNAINVYNSYINNEDFEYLKLIPNISNLLKTDSAGNFYLTAINDTWLKHFNSIRFNENFKDSYLNMSDLRISSTDEFKSLVLGLRQMYFYNSYANGNEAYALSLQTVGNELYNFLFASADTTGLLGYGYNYDTSQRKYKNEVAKRFGGIKDAGLKIFLAPLLFDGNGFSSDNVTIENLGKRLSDALIANELKMEITQDVKNKFKEQLEKHKNTFIQNPLFQAFEFLYSLTDYYVSKTAGFGVDGQHQDQSKFAKYSAQPLSPGHVGAINNTDALHDKLNVVLVSNYGKFVGNESIPLLHQNHQSKNSADSTDGIHTVNVNLYEFLKTSYGQLNQIIPAIGNMIKDFVSDTDLKTDISTTLKMAGYIPDYMLVYNSEAEYKRQYAMNGISQPVTINANEYKEIAELLGDGYQFDNYFKLRIDLAAAHYANQVNKKISDASINNSFEFVGKYVHQAIVKNNHFDELRHLMVYPGAVKVGGTNMQLDPEYMPVGSSVNTSFTVNSKNYRIQLNTVQNTENEYIKNSQQIVNSISATGDFKNADIIKTSLKNIIDLTLEQYNEQIERFVSNVDIAPNRRKSLINNFLKQLALRKVRNTGDMTQLQAYLQNPNINIEIPSIRNKVFEYLVSDLNNKLAVRLRGVRANQSRQMHDIWRFDGMALTRHGIRQRFGFDPQAKTSDELLAFGITKDTVGLRNYSYYDQNGVKINSQNEVNNIKYAKAAEVIMAHSELSNFGLNDGITMAEIFILQTDDGKYVNVKNKMYGLNPENNASEVVRKLLNSGQIGLNNLSIVVNALNTSINNKIEDLTNYIDSSSGASENANTLENVRNQIAYLEQIKEAIASNNVSAVTDMIVKWYEEFEKSLYVTGVRVPATGTNSGHYAEIVEFAPSNVSTIFITSEKNIIDGSDFDIDQLSVYFYSSNLFNEFDQEQIIKENANLFWSALIDHYRYSITMPDGSNNINNIINYTQPLTTSYAEDAVAELEVALSKNDSTSGYKPIHSFAWSHTRRRIEYDGEAIVGIAQNSLTSYNNLVYTHIKNKAQGVYLERLNKLIESGLMPGIFNQLGVAVNLGTDNKKINVYGRANISRDASNSLSGAITYGYAYLSNIYSELDLNTSQKDQWLNLFNLFNQYSIRYVFDRVRSKNKIGEQRQYLYDIINQQIRYYQNEIKNIILKTNSIAEINNDEYDILYNDILSAVKNKYLSNSSQDMTPIEKYVDNIEHLKVLNNISSMGEQLFRLSTVTKGRSGVPVDIFEFYEFTKDVEYYMSHPVDAIESDHNSEYYKNMRHNYYVDSKRNEIMDHESQVRALFDIHSIVINDQYYKSMIDTYGLMKYIQNNGFTAHTPLMNDFTTYLLEKQKISKIESEGMYVAIQKMISQIYSSVFLKNKLDTEFVVSDGVRYHLDLNNLFPGLSSFASQPNKRYLNLLSPNDQVDFILYLAENIQTFVTAYKNSLRDTPFAINDYSDHVINKIIVDKQSNGIPYIKLDYNILSSKDSRALIYSQQWANLIKNIPASNTSMIENARLFKKYLFLYEMIANQFSMSSTRISSLFSSDDFNDYSKSMNETDKELNDPNSSLYKQIRALYPYMFSNLYANNKNIASRQSRYYGKGSGISSASPLIREEYTKELLPTYVIATQKKTKNNILAMHKIDGDNIFVNGVVSKFPGNSLYMSNLIYGNPLNNSGTLLVNWNLLRLHEIDKQEIDENELVNVFFYLDYKMANSIRNGETVSVNHYNNNNWKQGFYLTSTGDYIRLTRNVINRTTLFIKKAPNNFDPSNDKIFSSAPTNENILANKKLKWLIKTLKKSFPRITVNTYSDPNDNRGSYVKNGIVYLNSSKVSSNIAMHEMAHIWLPIIESINKPLYDAIRTKAITSEVMEFINNSPLYVDHTAKDKEEEAMAYLIGNMSEKTLDKVYDSSANAKRSILGMAYDFMMGTIDTIYSYVFGSDYLSKYVRNINPATITLGEFLEDLTSKMLSGKMTISMQKSSDIAELRSINLAYASDFNIKKISDFKDSFGVSSKNPQIQASEIYDRIEQDYNGYLVYRDNYSTISLNLRGSIDENLDKIDNAINNLVLPSLGQRQQSAQSTVFTYLSTNKHRRNSVLIESGIGKIFENSDTNISMLDRIMDYNEIYDVVVNLKDDQDIADKRKNPLVASILTDDYIKTIGENRPLIIIHNAKATAAIQKKYGVDVSIIDFTVMEESAISINEKKSIIDKLNVSDFYKNRVKLKNNNHDHKKMALTLMAMKIKQQNPDITIRNTRVGFLGGQSIRYDEVYLPDTIKDMQVIRQILIDYASQNVVNIDDEIASIFNDLTLFNPTIYDKNYLSKLHSYVSMAINTNNISGLPGGVYSNIDENLDDRHALVVGATKRMDEIVQYKLKNGESEDSILSDLEYNTLAGIIFQFENRKFTDRNTMTDISDFEVLLRSSSRLNNDITIFARDAIVIGEKKINNIYMQDYYKPVKPVLKNLKMNSVVRNVLSDATESVYKRLFIYVDMEDDNGNIVRIPTGHIHYDENNIHTKRALEANEISRQDLDNAKIIVEHARKFAMQMFRNSLSNRYSGQKLENETKKYYEERWQDGMLPYVNKEFLGQLFEGKISESFQTLSNQLNRKDVLFQLDQKNDNTFDIEDRFLNQTGRSFVVVDGQKYNLGSDVRMGMAGYKVLIGMEKRTIYLAEPSKLDRISTNLESIMDYFAYNSIRHNIIKNDIMPKINAAKSMLYSYNYSAKFTASDKSAMQNNINYINIMTDKIIKGLRRNIDEVVNLGPNVNIKLNTLVETMRSVNTATGFMLNFGLFVRSMVNNLTQTLGNTMADSTSKMFWNAEDIAFATKEVFSNPKGSKGFQKIDALMDAFQMMNMDSYALMNSARRKVADQYMFNSDTMYFLNYIPDYITRATIMIAALHNSGSYEAYNLDDNGTLVYDETKDKRWQKPNGEIIKNDVKREQIKQGLLGSMDEKMKLSHDFYEADVWKNYSDNYIVGQMDQISQVNANIYGLGKIFLQFQNYLTAKRENLYTRKYSDRSMSYRTVQDKDGKQEVVWHSNMMEGKINTLLDTFAKIKNQQKFGLSDFNKLSPYQVRNLTKSAADLGIYTSLIIIFTLLKDSDDERLSEKAKKSRKDEKSKLLKWSTQAIDDLIIDYKFLSLSIITGSGSGSYSIPLVNQMKRYSDIVAALGTFEFEEGLEKISKNIPGNQVGKDIYNTVLEETNNVE